MDELVSVRPKETLNALMATTTTNVGCCIVAGTVAEGPACSRWKRACQGKNQAGYSRHHV